MWNAVFLAAALAALLGADVATAQQAGTSDTPQQSPLPDSVTLNAVQICGKVGSGAQ